MTADIPPSTSHSEELVLEVSTSDDSYFKGKTPLERLKEFQESSTIDSRIVSWATADLSTIYLGPSIRVPTALAAFPDFPVAHDDIAFHGRGPTGPAFPLERYGIGLRRPKHWPLVANDNQWLKWHRYMKQHKAEHWKRLGIFHLLEFSTQQYEVHPEGFAAALHLWVRSTNAFYFRNRPMTPTLLDLKLLVDIPISGLELSPSRLHRDGIIHHDKHTSFGPFAELYFKERTEGPTDQEYFAFLVYFLCRFVIYGAAKGPTKVLYPLAAALLEADTQVALGPIILGSLYRCLGRYSIDLNVNSAITGPLWLLQMWLHMYFGHVICTSPFHPHRPDFWRDLDTVNHPLYSHFLEFEGRDFLAIFTYLYDDGTPCPTAPYAILAPRLMTPADWGSALTSRDLFIHNSMGQNAEKGVEVYSANLVAHQFGLFQHLPAPIGYSLAWDGQTAFDKSTVAMIDEMTRLLVRPIDCTWSANPGATTPFDTWWTVSWKAFYKWPTASDVLKSSAPAKALPLAHKKLRSQSSSSTTCGHNGRTTQEETTSSGKGQKREAYWKIRGKRAQERSTKKAKTDQPTSVSLVDIPPESALALVDILEPARVHVQASGSQTSMAEPQIPAVEDGLVKLAHDQASVVPADVEGSVDADGLAKSADGEGTESSREGLQGQTANVSTSAIIAKGGSAHSHELVEGEIGQVKDDTGQTSAVHQQSAEEAITPVIAASPTTSPPLVDLSSLFEEVGAMAVPPAPALTASSTFDSHRPFKEALLATLDQPLGIIKSEEFVVVGQAVQKLLTLGIPDLYVAAVLESAPAMFQRIKAAFDDAHHGSFEASNHVSSFNETVARFTDLKDEVGQLHQAFQDRAKAYDAKKSRIAALEKEIEALRAEMVEDESAMRQIKGKIAQMPYKLHRLKEGMAAHRQDTASYELVRQFYEDGMAKASREWSEEKEKLRGLLDFI